MKNNRQSIRLRNFDYTSSGAYFVTICSDQREDLFGSIGKNVMYLSGLGEVILETWNAIPAHFSSCEIDEFVVMPNHIHGILWLNVSAQSSPFPVGAQHAAPLHVDAQFITAQRDTTPTHVDAQFDANHRTSKTPITPQYQYIPEPRLVTANSLGAIIRSFKAAVTKQARANNPETKVWQRNYHEHIIRNDSDLERIRTYIHTNPHNWQHDHQATTDLELHQHALAEAA
jgi:putative transposase